MIRSMTGFGSESRALEEGSVTVEARSVNSRHLRVVVRGPESLEAWEPELRAVVAEQVQRGRVELSIAVESTGRRGGELELDEERIEAYLKALEVLKQKYRLAGEPDAAVLLQAGGMLREREEVGPDWLPLEELAAATVGAVQGLVQMREEEGARLEADLRERLAALRKGVAEVERLAPERLGRERERLRKAVEEVAGDVVFDDDRLAREIAVIADRWDIGEEIVRAAAHLDAFEEYVAAPAAEAVGKRLSFLVQELQREINTMGAKANDTSISREVVEMKNQVEKMREQVENVE